VRVGASLVPGLDGFPTRQVRRVTLTHPVTGDTIDDALCVVMRAPASYTGEDVVELSCHGSPALLRLVVELLIARGARSAEPGEFTRRAFLNGKMDLRQAEAVAMLITARTERAVMLAARALSGALSERLRELHDAVLDLVASLEVVLDFPDEELSLDVGTAAKRARALAHEVDRLVAAARRGRIIHDGVTAAIVGPPNAGKSSIFNALLGHARAIVSPEPGTTRDVVDGVIAVHGVPIRLLDTAGLGTARDAIDAEGMRRTRSAMAGCDVLVVVQDGSVPYDERIVVEISDRARVLVRSKSDLPVHPSHLAWEAVSVSAVTGSGLDDLIGAIATAVAASSEASDDESEMAASVRQLQLLERTRDALLAAGDALGTVPVEAALIELRDALISIADVRGVAVADSVLDRIFATFCIGK
jgi:tRNA modification GTPase